MCEASPFDTEESLIESLQGLFKGNDKTFFGEAYHSLLEGNYTNQAGQIHVNEFIFTFEQAKPAIEYRKNHELLVSEMSISAIYKTKYFPVQITGRIDGIEGMHVRDGKTKFRSFTAEEYMNSCQWKFYLDILSLRNFFYDIFEVVGFDTLPYNKPYYFGDTISVSDPVEIPCEAYENMHNDLVCLLNDFLDYIHNRNFIKFLKPAFEVRDLTL